MAGHGWPMGKEPDRAWERGHKGQGTEHRDMEMEQDSDGDRDEKEHGDWAEPGKRGGTGHGNRDKEMGKGKGTGTQSWEKASEQGHRHGDGTEYRDRAWNRDGTGHKDTRMGLTGLPIATGPPALLVGAGSGVGIVCH